MNKQWLDRGACPKCGSSDGNVQHSEGYSHCFVCKTRFKKGNNMEAEKIIPIRTESVMKTLGILGALSERSISKETAKKYNTDVKLNGNMNTHHIYKYFDEGGNNIANKIREVDAKKFWSEGNLASSGLFGQHIFGKAGKFITVCEGEIDAMSAYELLGSKWPVVSIKNGAASALQNCRDSFEYLNKFEQVVLCFDNDKAGKRSGFIR